MFTKILIANRGEIACRVIRTARRLGIRTVAVFSDADRHALHVKQADEAIHIGASSSSESYLVIDRVIQAALKSGAEAIHPGYGFLSENAEFAQACADNDLVFIGPPTAAIQAMGSKSAAKSIMEKAGVPLVPGYHGDDQDPVLLKKSADDMGYPVLLKAVAGGGGKGMRQVWKEEEFEHALEQAKRESQASFGDDQMLVEKYLTQPRHVEVQVFCDNHGNGVYLFERDCSVQRRHQKIIEEAPAPELPEALRHQMGYSAVQAARAIDYRGAGTVEFLLDTTGEFYFMEMNTRLQVEHPVTELITGQDLVEWQLRVANDETLPATQENLSINGHAFEARIYAEDPNNQFLPTAGHLTHLRTPAESDHVRVDTGVVQGDEVSPYYDPMIAKLIVWDEDRDRALARLTRALTEYRISGVTTNIQFLYSLATSAPFADAELDTGFIEKHQDILFAQPASELSDKLVLISLFLILDREQHSAPESPWDNLGSWRLNQPNSHHHQIEIGGESLQLDAEETGPADDRQFSVATPKGTSHATADLQNSVLIAEIDGHRQQATIVKHDDTYTVFSEHGALDFSLVKPDLGEADQAAAGGDFSAPMNGTIVEVMVKAGENVQAGDALIIMEAMKMQHTILAPADGTVTELFCADGELVDGGAQLLSFEAG